MSFTLCDHKDFGAATDEARAAADTWLNNLQQLGWVPTGGGALGDIRSIAWTDDKFWVEILDSIDEDTRELTTTWRDDCPLEAPASLRTATRRRWDRTANTLANTSPGGRSWNWSINQTSSNSLGKAIVRFAYATDQESFA